MKQRAAILGATGLVGNELLSLLLQDEFYEEVLVIGRSSVQIEHPRLREKIGDLLEEDFFNDPIEAMHVFCCVGTTQSKTSDLSVYKHIDYGIPVKAAQAGLRGGMQKFLVISSIGANATSKMFYSRTKGQMEEALQKMAIPRLHIFRPSLLLGERDESRWGEKVGKLIIKALGWALPSKYKGIKAITVAKAMHKVAKGVYNQEIIESDKIREIAAS